MPLGGTRHVRRIFEAEFGVSPLQYLQARRLLRVNRTGGANIWTTTDAFQFAWHRLSGDVTLTAGDDPAVNLAAGDAAGVSNVLGLALKGGASEAEVLIFDLA